MAEVHIYRFADGQSHDAPCRSARGMAGLRPAFDDEAIVDLQPLGAALGIAMETLSSETIIML